MNSKTLILSPLNDKQNGRGIITVYLEDDLLKCKIRLYDMPTLPNSTKLGVYHKGEVYKSNLLYKYDSYTSSLVGDFDMNGDFYVALVDTENGNTPLLAGGTYSAYFSETDDAESLPEMSDTLCHPEYFNESPMKTDFVTEKRSDQLIWQQLHEANEQEKESQLDNQPTEQQTDNHRTKVDFDDIQQSIMSQFTYIFDNYPIDTELNQRIENSNFVRVQEGEDNYSIGAIYDSTEIKYMCYAVKTKYNTPAPIELGEHYQWLPLDSEDPLSDGYYIVYQDAHDLKIVEV